MKRILLLALLLISSFGFGQEVVIEWQKSLGGSLPDFANSIQQTTDGGYIVAGRSSSIDGDITGNIGGIDYWIVKLDSSGDLTWQKSIGGSGDDRANSIQQTTDGGYIIAGRSNSIDGDVTGNHGDSDSWIVKLDATGNISWQKSLGGSGDDCANSIQQTTDGGYIVAGYSNSNDGDVIGNHGSWDYWVVKLDASGNTTWQNSLGGSDIDFGESIQQTTDGGYIVAGRCKSVDGDITGNHGSNDNWVVKLDASGNIAWQKALGGSVWDYGFSVRQTLDGGFIVAGFSHSNDGDVSGNQGSADSWIVKLDVAGNISWQKSLGGTGTDHALSIQQTTDGGYIAAGISGSNNGDVTGNNGSNDYWVIKIDESGNITWQKSLGGIGNDQASFIQQTTDGGYIVAGQADSNTGDITGNHGGWDYWIVKLEVSNISGSVFNDINQNCIQETSEPGLPGIPVTISPGGYIAQVNNNGMWYLDSLPIGTYTATIDTTNSNWTPTCPVSQPFTVTDPEIYTHGPDFGMVNNNPCSSPDISINAPFLRRCFSDQVIYVQSCNEITATGALNSAYAEVELDSLFTPTSSSLPYTTLGDNLYRFELGNINPGQCIDFTINTTVSCDALLGETLCMDANLYPVDSCALDSVPTNPLPPNYGNNPNLVMPQTCTLPWDRSSLQVEGWCQGDSVQFSVTNTGVLGDGDMDCYSPVLLYVNDTLVNIDSIQLLGQETIYYSYPASGETWIMAVEQHPLHPGNSHPNAHVELCGSDSTKWISDLINNRPHDDANPVVDIYCGVVTGSYDPNDKRGFPIGVTEQNHIQPNQQLQYVVRFQNTGTDTAFTVVIRDTLDTDLNIFTVTPGVSSHDYTFRKYGPRVLEWTFDDIMLPDSTTDEPGSNGFVTFTVDQVPDLPNGTLINNQADIYFDFNAPIITNETDHLINDMIESNPIGDFVVQTVSGCSNYTWSTNGQTYNQSGVYTEVLTNQVGLDSTVTLNLTINQPNTGSESVTNCDSYTWSADGQTYNQSGNYTTVLTNTAGCDSTVNLDLTITNSNSSIEAFSACDSYVWSTNGQTYNESGTYTTVLTNAAGCDSTVTLDLTITNSNSSTETASVCNNYMWNTNGQTYTQSGQYTEVLTNQSGCDSTITLDLIINEPTSGSETISTCDSFTWSTNGQTYTESGQYTEVLTNDVGCDSIVTLELTINKTTNNSQTHFTCDSFIWPVDGQTYNQSGTYTTVLTNAAGCDSIITLDLTITNSSSSTESVSSCDSYTWSTNGQSYTQSGQYTEILTNQYGCDSTVTLDLTINTANNTITQIDDITLEANADNAQYQWVNCDQNYQLIPGESNQSFEASSNGNYAAIITENGCTDTTDCVTISNVGLKDFERETLNIYPNPTSKTFTISSENTINSTFKVVSAEGKEVLSGKMDGKEQTIDISNLSKGVYSVVFDNSELPVLSVIKE